MIFKIPYWTHGGIVFQNCHKKSGEDKDSSQELLVYTNPDDCIQHSIVEKQSKVTKVYDICINLLETVIDVSCEESSLSLWESIEFS